MAYVYGSSKKRPVVAAVPLPPVTDPDTAEAPAQSRRKRVRVPGRKRGPGKNNKHGTGCGSRNGWMAHKRAGEDPCEDCNVANRAYKNASAKRARGRNREVAA